MQRTEFITSRAVLKEIMPFQACYMRRAWKNSPLRRDEVPTRRPKTTPWLFRAMRIVRCSDTPRWPRSTTFLISTFNASNRCNRGRDTCLDRYDITLVCPRSGGKKLDALGNQVDVTPLLNGFIIKFSPNYKQAVGNVELTTSRANSIQTRLVFPTDQIMGISPRALIP